MNRWILKRLRTLDLRTHFCRDRLRRLWRGDFGTSPPFDIGPDSLFVAYSAWAEMTCFKVLGWQFPVHVFDQHTAYLADTRSGEYRATTLGLSFFF